MAIQGTWIAVDTIGSLQGGEIFIHSAAKARVSTSLRRCAKGIGLDKKGEAVVRAVIEAALSGREIPKVDGLYVETHQVAHPMERPSASLSGWASSRRRRGRSTTAGSSTCKP